MTTVYILGAGASAAEGAPTIKNFFGKAYDEFYHDRYSEQPIKDVWRFIEQYYHQDLDKIQDIVTELPQIDEVISTVDWAKYNNISLLPRYKAKETEELRRGLMLLLSKTLDRTLNKPTPNKHDQLVEYMLEEAGKQNLNIISLNYDILIDQAIIRRIESSPYYGIESTTGKVRLYKLHGSLNWGICQFCQKIAIVKEKIAHELHYGTKRCKKCPESELEPVLVTPTMLKSYNIPQLPKVWNEAFHSIAKADKLVFIGYSLPPADFGIIELIKRAVHFGRGTLKEVNVIDMDLNVVKRYSQIFGSIPIRYSLEGFQGIPTVTTDLTKEELVTNLT